MFRLIAIVLVLYAAGFVVFVMSLPGPMPHMQPAQGIVALTGGDERLAAAVSLLENREGQRLLISGVHPSTTKEELKRLAHGGARFDCCADLGYSAANTRGNAEEAARWAHAHRFRSLIVVTARYHMPRSLTEFQAAMPDVALEAYPIEPQDIDLGAWWHDVRALHVLHGEYVKYLASTVMNAVNRKDPAPDRKDTPGKAHTASR
jgi:uncharacterized SAM-binding protein YcdF (DUF218 family)